jgi:lipoprotein-anchoring transpeptidase ErfK/SrfK
MNRRFNQGLTRGEFLKICSVAACLPFGLSNLNSTHSTRLRSGGIAKSDNANILLALSEFEDFRFSNPGVQGRVLSEYLFVYSEPATTSNIIKTYWRDSVIPITDVTISEDSTAYNPVWYRIGEEGYAHSGVIQPVATILQQPVDEIPAGGALAEVTVPFTDARWAAGKDKRVAYRYYYATTHWILGLEYDPDSNPWYHVMDDKWKFTFFVPAEHLRLIPEAEVTPISPEVPTILKRIMVHLPEQMLIAYEGDEPVFMARIASGAKFSDGNYTTPSGHHLTFHKRPSRHMAAGNLAYNGYDLPGVPWICYITESGIAFHGTYWHNDYGHPRSHGCINLSPQAAKWIYRWTIPIVPSREQRVYETYGTSVFVID